MSAVGTKEVGRADSAVEVLRHRQAVEARIRRWFPGTVAAHTIYQHLAAAGTRPGDPVLHLGAGYDSLQTLSALNAGSVIALDLDGWALAPLPEARRRRRRCITVPLWIDRSDRLRVRFRASRKARRGAGRMRSGSTGQRAPRLHYPQLLQLRFSGGGLDPAVVPRVVPLAPDRGFVSGRHLPDLLPAEHRRTHPSRGTARRPGAGLDHDGGRMANLPRKIRVAAPDRLHRIGVFLHWLLERGPSGAACLASWCSGEEDQMYPSG